jgi:prepilin-type N-terminal cleavage/methylation domain-containing protein
MRGFRRKLAGLRPGGFTLVELAVVSAILAGLAVAVVTYVGSTSQTVNTEMTATVDEVRTGVDTSGLGQYGGAVAQAAFYLAPNGVTVKCEEAAFGDTGVVGGVTYTKRTFAEIQDNHSLASASCTSGITNMGSMFVGAQDFNEDISTWDTSNVTVFAMMFAVATNFNQDISAWDTSAVLSMTEMFVEAFVFNQDLSGWCVAQIGSEPFDFDHKAESWVLPRPLWGQACS